MELILSLIGIAAFVALGLYDYSKKQKSLSIK